MQNLILWDVPHFGTCHKWTAKVQAFMRESEIGPYVNYFLYLEENLDMLRKTAHKYTKSDVLFNTTDIILVNWM